MAKLELATTDMSQDSIGLGSADLESIFDVVVKNDFPRGLGDDEYILLKLTTVADDPPKRNAYLVEERAVLG